MQPLPSRAVPQRESTPGPAFVLPHRPRPSDPPQLRGMVMCRARLPNRARDTRGGFVGKRWPRERAREE